MRRWVCAAVGVASAVVIAGCSSRQQGQPIAAASSDPPPASTTDATGVGGQQAPRIRTPLNDVRLISDPCSALTSGQLQALGFTPAVKTHVEQSAVGNVCKWDDDTIGVVGASAGIGVETALSHGLSDIYAQRSGMAYFTPVTIEGYPAVLDDLSDQRDSGTCALNLGVSDSSVLSIDYEQHDLGASACDRVQAIARAMIETLRGT
ncbi:MAG TPA: DUF3558 domain-containing protein [Pseudonocardiaceae bacterium]|jgi:hypothetical protein|nr:DUF3558 domain-containing protein [Pseudonocardiaceae bacterium]